MILQEKDIKPFFNIISKFEVMRSTHKLTNGMSIEFVKNTSDIISISLIDTHNDVSFKENFYLPYIPTDLTAFVNKLNEHLMFSYISILHNSSKEFKEGFQSLMEAEPENSLVSIVNNIINYGIIDIYSEEYKELWDDIVRGNYK